MGNFSNYSNFNNNQSFKNINIKSSNNTNHNNGFNIPISDKYFGIIEHYNINIINIIKSIIFQDNKIFNSSSIIQNSSELDYHLINYLKSVVANTFSKNNDIISFSNKCVRSLDNFKTKRDHTKIDRINLVNYIKSNSLKNILDLSNFDNITTLNNSNSSKMNLIKNECKYKIHNNQKDNIEYINYNYSDIQSIKDLLIKVTFNYLKSFITNINKIGYKLINHISYQLYKHIQTIYSNILNSNDEFNIDNKVFKKCKNISNNNKFMRIEFIKNNNTKDYKKIILNNNNIKNDNNTTK